MGKRLSVRRNGQLEQRAHFRIRNKQIGIPTIIVSSIVGSAVFGTIGTTDMVPLQIAAGALRNVDELTSTTMRLLVEVRPRSLVFSFDLHTSEQTAYQNTFRPVPFLW